jgi:thioredoxin 1
MYGGPPELIPTTQTKGDEMNHIETIQSSQYEQEVLRSKLPVLVKVSTRWCPPCRAMAPIVNEIAATYADRLKVVEIDGDEASDIVEALQVRGFPTMVMFSNGQEIGRLLGAAPKARLVKLLQEWM